MPPPNVRVGILRAVATGQLGNNDVVSETVPGIGPTLAANLNRSLRPRARTALTVGQFWRATRPLTTVQLTKALHRALQNERGNQCVSTRIGGVPTKTYHTGDINEAAYQASVALVDADRAAGSAVTSAPLRPRLHPRTLASKTCGCRDLNNCNGVCTLSDDGRACVPRSVQTRGFVGVAPHPDQGVVAFTDAARRSVRNSARTRRNSPGVRRDQNAQRDLRAGHATTMRYSKRGNKVWRSPGRKVRLPLR